MSPQDPFDGPVRPFRASHIAKQLAAVVARDEPDGVWRCRYCRAQVRELTQRPSAHDVLPEPERDHVVPRSRGGVNAMENYAVACQGCNVRKGARLLSELPDDWHQWRSAVSV